MSNGNMSAAHVIAMFTQSGYARAREVLAERKAAPEFAAQLLQLRKDAEKKAAAEAARKKTAGVMAAQRAEGARRASAAQAAAVTDKVMVIAPTPATKSLAAEEAARRDKVAARAQWLAGIEAAKAADAARCAEAEKVVKIGGYSAKRGRGGSRKTFKDKFQEILK